MTRREKAQMSILAAIDSRTNRELGREAPALMVEGYAPETINAIADEMEQEGLIKAEIEYNEAEKVETVIPHGLTARGKEYLKLLEKAK